MKVVVICPGRGTYTKAELGSLFRLHPDKADLFARFDAQRRALGQETLADLDGAATYSVARHTRGDNASALIYAAGLADFLSLRNVEVVAVTGNSMGWYTALACAGAVSADDGFRVVNTMGTLMQEALIGGQIVHPFMSEDWRADPDRKARLLALVAAIDARPGRVLALSIDLGGMLVLAGNAEGLAEFEAEVPPEQGRFPLRLSNHAAFHTALQAPVAQRGQAALPVDLFGQPAVPLIDGRGCVWWPKASDPGALRSYTLGHQVTEAYDFTRAVTVAAREFAPDAFVVLGPGTTLGGAVAQSLILAGWRGMMDKTGFQTRQAEDPLLIALGREDQRRLVTGGTR